MKKPTKQVVTYYEYIDIIKYIEKMYEIETRDYYGHFGGKSVKWPGAGSGRPYANFWHWMIHSNPDTHNGCYVYFPYDYTERKVNLDPKCYEENYECLPQFVVEILDMIVAEFGKEILTEKIWVDW